MTISNQTRDRVKGIFEPIALAMGRLGVTPNALTLIGFAIAIVAALAAAQQAWLLTGILVIGGGLFDMFDGILARARGTASRLGAFLDSVFDRAGDAVVYLGIVWGTLDMGLWRPVVLATAAMAASSMVSYVRAKSEGLGFTPGRGMAAVGLAPREVRIVILTAGLIMAGLLPGYPEDMDQPGALAYPLSALALEGALGLIAVLATASILQRIIHVTRQASNEEQQ